MSRELLDRYCERGILGLVLTILVIGPLALGGVRGLEFAIIQALTAAVGALWLARLWLAPKPQLLWPPICWAVLAFGGYAVVRYLNADVEYVARQELLRILVYTLLFFAVLNNLHGRESTKAITFTVIFLGLAIAGYGIYQFVAESKKIWSFETLYPGRASGTYICPNHFAGFLEVLLPLALAYTVTGRLKPLTRVLVGYAAAVILAGIAVSVSRLGWISTGVALLAFVAALLFRRHYRVPAVVLLVGVAGIGTAFLMRSTFSYERLSQVLTPGGTFNDGLRFPLWVPAYQMWRHHPWWGVGPAHYDVRFRAYRPEGVQLTPDRVHNDYLNTLTDWGIVGTVLVASAWGLLGIGVLKTWRSRRLAPVDFGTKVTSDKYAFVLGASLGLLAILVHSVGDFNMHIPANAILVVTMMALLSAHLRFASDRYWVSAGAAVKVLMSVLALGLSLYLLPQAWRTASEFTWLQRANKAENISRAQLQFLERAHTLEPMNPATTYRMAEWFRRRSQEGGLSYHDMEGVDYRSLAEEAMKWFERGIALNPYDSRNFAGYGWCLDWLDRTSESEVYFTRAEQLDPNNFFNLNNIGLHYVQAGNLAAAKPWFERSRRLEWSDNAIAHNYLRIIEARMLESATNQLSLRFGPGE